MNARPCPFCGGDELEIIDPSEYAVGCEACGAMGPWSTDRDNAVELWNNRTSLEE